MNVFDIVIILLILMSGVIGLKRGFIEEAILLIGTILIYIIAFLCKGFLGVALCKYATFFDFHGLITVNILLYQIIAFVSIVFVLFVAFRIILKASNLVQKLVDMYVVLAIPSKILGAIIGLIEGYILVYVLLVVLAIPFGNVELLKESTLNQKIVNDSVFFSDKFGDLSDITSDMLVVEADPNGNVNLDQINLYIMGKELKYNVVTKEEALEIIDTGKLDDITGIKEFVEGYEPE